MEEVAGLKDARANVHVKHGAIEAIGSAVLSPHGSRYATLIFEDGTVYKKVYVDSAVDGRLGEEGTHIFKKGHGGWRLIGHDNGQPGGVRVSSNSGVGMEYFANLFYGLFMGFLAFVVAFLALWSGSFWFFFVIFAGFTLYFVLNILLLVSLGSAISEIMHMAKNQAKSRAAAAAA